MHRQHQLKAERDGAAVEHSDRPAAGDELRGRLFAHHFGVEGEIFLFQVLSQLHLPTGVAFLPAFRSVRGAETVIHKYSTAEADFQCPGGRENILDQMPAANLQNATPRVNL